MCDALLTTRESKIPFKPAKHFLKEYGISSATMRGWESAGRVECVRLPGGKRMYDVDSVLKLLGQQPVGKRAYIYARVSSAKQSADLERQIEDLQKAYPGHVVIKDVASGVNFKRKGLQHLLELVLKGMVSELAVAHRDRLARIGCDLLEFIFDKAGVKLVVLGGDEDDQHDLADDLFAVTTLFVASYNGRRSAENRKRRKIETSKDGGAESDSSSSENSHSTHEGAKTQD
jgi:putative resolvase